MIVADEAESYAFDMADKWLPREQLLALFAEDRVWYFANAKFDMAMLAEECGAVFGGTIHDLAVVDRILDSGLRGGDFNLAATARRYAMEKSNAVELWIQKNGCYDEIVVEGRKAKEKIPRYDRVPRPVLVPYAEKDARITYDIGERQVGRLAQSDLDHVPSLQRIVENERELTRTVYAMERRGVKVDLSFCRRAADAELAKHRSALAEFRALAGVDYKSSEKALAPLFAGEERKVLTPTGKMCFDEDALKLYKSPLADVILRIRGAKKASEYYTGFLHHAAPDGRIHASFNQHLAWTGRFSSSGPNLQNMTKNEEGEVLAQEFVVRRALVPAPGFFFAMFDYDQMEYRLMLEYARCMALIEKVLSGLDVHEATAQLAGITRRQAKTTNFLTIYGGGDGILAQNLGVSLAEAQRIRGAIFEAAPELQTFLRSVVRRAEDRKFIFNWLGRRLYYPNRNDSYKAPNGLIQGGCADIVKVGMNRVHHRLRGMKTQLVLQVHDEFVLECHESEASVLPEIKEIMEAVYPAKLIPLTAGADHSFKSLADKVEGLPAA